MGHYPQVVRYDKPNNYRGMLGTYKNMDDIKNKFGKINLTDKSLTKYTVLLLFYNKESKLVVKQATHRWDDQGANIESEIEKIKEHIM